MLENLLLSDNDEDGNNDTWLAILLKSYTEDFSVFVSVLVGA